MNTKTVKQRKTFKGILKVGKKEHLESLRDGNVYCNTVQYFREMEDDGNGMADRNEGGDSVFHFEKLSIYKEGKYIPVARKLIAVNHSGIFNGNLFCGYFIDIEVDLDTPKPVPVNFTNSILNFTNADSFMIIENILEFSLRFDNAVQLCGNKLYCEHVKYLDFKKYEGKLNPFIKHTRFKEQNEFRYYIDRESISKDDKQVYELGNLSDVTSEVMDIKYLSDMIICNKGIIYVKSEL